MVLCQSFYPAGIIPAYAGSTCPSQKWCRWWRDHPRVCGEHLVLLLLVRLAQGSSPRMRGAPVWKDPYAIGNGIIPAYAGSTQYVRIPKPITGDHPRVCGEHFFTTKIFIGGRGSSPRMRGAPQTNAGDYDLQGIIPAYAGSTYLP